MSYSLIWLPSVLKAAGLQVSLCEGWETRGHGDMGRIRGVLCHHTGVKGPHNMPTLRSLINGRKGGPGIEPLAGPLANLGLGRDGAYYVIAAGRSYHAGKGVWQGSASGNTSFIGIEAENDGDGEKWPPVQLEAYCHGVAAILMHEGLDVSCCAGHKEYTSRKPDPSFDMHDFRGRVAEVMAGTAAPIEPIPSVEPPPHAGAPAGRATLFRGKRGELVADLQRRLGIGTDGEYGPVTEAAVRAFQRLHGLVPDGKVGPITWRALDLHAPR